MLQFHIPPPLHGDGASTACLVLLLLLPRDDHLRQAGLLHQPGRGGGGQDEGAVAGPGAAWHSFL